MATPLTPIPPKPQPAQRNPGPLAVFGAGLAALATAAVIAATPGTALAQDPTYEADNAWVPEQVQAPAAWETTKGKGVTVAVLDTGINDHPFFADKDILPGYSALGTEDGTGWNDTDGHGSAIAAAVLLTAPEATIMPVRIGTGASVLSGGMGDIQFDAVRWAVDNGADVLVVPWAIYGRGFEGDYLEVLQYAIDKGAMIIASAGNDPDEEVPYPGFVPGVVTVTGTDRNGDIWFENTTTGPEVELAAPADSMTAPLPQDSSLGNTDLYADVVGGTSMGSGVAGGVAALTWASHPDLDASNVIQRMIQTAGDGSGNKAEDTGYGLVNADQAVHAEGIEEVAENPLGYPMGEAGASGASPDDEGTDEPTESEAVDESAGPAAGGAEASKESNLSTTIVVAAAVVLIGAAIAVWLVLRGRGRKNAAAGEPGPYNPASSPVQGGYQQPPAMQQQYGGPPMGGSQGYGAPPPPGPQGYSSPPRAQQGFTLPPNGGDQGTPWRPSDPNRQ
ncbi:S8 family serine peptidase [Glycomyces tritici]|uniref:S8 family serine peptidase n=1 Tax=Glycomyces tritici TaxID=2665176 RepID=A0ABT7YWH1_9ACTN|nr:S8 family serine peptidase [Glycomyces tritici]MDN3242995.1 S8 family serine peptidase [Glycomyces tritici]